MITVRFPNGQAIQYNTAHWAEHYDKHVTLKTSRDGTLVAWVPLECVVDFVSPCRVHNPLISPAIMQLEEMARTMRSLNYKVSRLMPKKPKRKRS